MTFIYSQFGLVPLITDILRKTCNTYLSLDFKKQMLEL